MARKGDYAGRRQLKMDVNGARIKKIRLEKGITLEEAHKKTKIHLDILRAIEEDDFINLSPVYVKGFLKIYCNFLGIDPREFTSSFKEIKVKPRIVPPKEDLKPDKVINEEPGVKTVWPHAEKSKKIIRIIFVIIALIVVANILFNLGTMLVNKLRVSRARRIAISASKKEKKATATTSRTSATASSKVKVTSPPAAPKVTETVSSIRLAIRARESSWLQVKTDGRVVFKNILKKGRSESWEAKEKIELSLGNVGVVDLEINSKLIPSLGRRGEVLKNILITKEGLNIKR